MSEKEPIELTEEQLDLIIGGLSTMIIQQVSATNPDLPSLDHTSPSLPNLPTPVSGAPSPLDLIIHGYLSSPTSGSGAPPPLNLIIPGYPSLPTSDSVRVIGSSHGGPSYVGGLPADMHIQGMDLETAMMAVKTIGVDAVEGLLKAQTLAVQERNTQIADLNSLSTTLNGHRDEGLKLDSAISPDSNETYRDKLSSLGIDVDLDKDGRIAGQEVDAAVNLIQGQLQSLSSSQQTDMLRLQSLTNKRNEALETMANFIKEMQESRASIIGNLG